MTRATRAHARANSTASGGRSTTYVSSWRLLSIFNSAEGSANNAIAIELLDDLERCRVFRPLIDHLVDNAPLHCHFPSQVVGALAPVGLLDHHGDKGIHVDINGVAHGSTCLRPAAWDRRRESVVLLQNRNAFGHGL